MKKYIVLLIATSATFVCSAKYDVKLHGKIKHPIADSISVSFNEGKIKYTPQTIATKINSDGTFTLEFNIHDQFTTLEVIHGNQSTDLVVQPTSDLEVVLDANDFDKTLTYSGHGQEIANFMAKHTLEMGLLDNYDREAQGLYANNPNAFMKLLNQLKEKELTYLNQNKSNLPDNFVKYWSERYTYDEYYRMSIYAPVHEMIKHQRQNVALSEYDSESFAVIKNVPMAFNDNYLFIPEYRNYIDNYFALSLSAHGIENSVSNHAEAFKRDDSAITLAYKYMPSKTAEYFIAKVLCNFSKNYSFQREIQLFNIYKKHFPKSIYSESVREVISQKRKMQPGNTAFDFTLKTKDGKEVRLSNLKGKVVYIDFWASWCVPCISQLASMAKIENHFKNENDVVFLNISIDKDDSEWRRALQKYNIKGVNMRDNDGWNGLVASLYGVKTIPSSFLIDKNGNFALTTVPNPSEPESVIRTIEKFLNNN